MLILFLGMMVNSENSESPSGGSIELAHQQPQYQEHTPLLEIKPDHDAVLSHLKQEEPSPLEENQQQQHVQQLQPQHVNGNVSGNDTSLPSVEITEYSPEWAYPEVGRACFSSSQAFQKKQQILLIEIYFAGWCESVGYWTLVFVLSLHCLI